MRYVAQAWARVDQTKATERRFQRLIESVTHHAIYLLNPEGYIASWNPGAANITGYSAEEALGQHFSRLFTEDDGLRSVPLTALRATWLSTPAMPCRTAEP